MLPIGLVPDYPAAMAEPRKHVLIVGDRRRPGVSEGVAAHLPFLESCLVEIDYYTDHLLTGSIEVPVTIVP